MEFCGKCGGMMLPSKDKEQKILICNACGKNIPLENEMIDAYKFHKKITHPPGEEFMNLEKMENWEKKEIYYKFKH